MVQLLGVGTVTIVHTVRILDGQLQEIQEGLVGPATSSPGETIIRHQLVNEIDAAHVSGVVTNDDRPLDGDPLVVSPASPLRLP